MESPEEYNNKRISLIQSRSSVCHNNVNKNNHNSLKKRHIYSQAYTHNLVNNVLCHKIYPYSKAKNEFKFVSSANVLLKMCYAKYSKLYHFLHFLVAKASLFFLHTC